MRQDVWAMTHNSAEFGMIHWSCCCIKSVFMQKHVGRSGQVPRQSSLEVQNDQVTKFIGDIYVRAKNTFTLCFSVKVLLIKIHRK
jgi:hypothetical protein